IELFFRWIKQHLNIPTLFGTTENAVYGQLYSALIAYVLLKAFYDAGNSLVPPHEKMSFIQFSRLLLLHNLPSVWIIKLSLLRERSAVFIESGITVSG
ncbi:MAG: IS4 family transposase, partial [Paenibacillus sp.]|nr:IS4 family transposase [Paenibacillus sp.]